MARGVQLILPEGAIIVQADPARLSQVFVNLLTVEPSFENGWARLNFTGTGPTAGLSSATGGVTVTNVATGVATAGQNANFKGLPVIGFMARTLNNGTLTCTSVSGTSGSCQGSYGSLFDHKYQVFVTP